MDDWGFQDLKMNVKDVSLRRASSVFPCGYVAATHMMRTTLYCCCILRVRMTRRLYFWRETGSKETERETEEWGGKGERRWRKKKLIAISTFSHQLDTQLRSHLLQIGLQVCLGGISFNC